MDAAEEVKEVADEIEGREEIETARAALHEEDVIAPADEFDEVKQSSSALVDAAEEVKEAVVGGEEVKTPWWRRPRVIRLAAIGAVVIAALLTGGAVCSNKGDGRRQRR